MKWNPLNRRALLLAIALLIGCAPSEDAGPIEPSDAAAALAPQEATTAADFPAGDDTGDAPAPGEVSLSAISLAGLEEQLAKSHGNVVVLDVWSTNCVPCMKEFHHLVELSKRSPDKLTCFSLNVDYIGLPKRPPDDYLPAVKEFLTEKQATSVRNYLSTDSDSDVLEKYAVEAMPAILVFDRAGELVAKLTDANASGEGVTYEADVIPLVEKLLKSE